MSQRSQNIRCLIIDDEAPARRVIQKYLSELKGYEVLAECKNAFEALDWLEREDPDLIFLDINMPKLSGLKFLETLQDPPLVVITSAYREYALEGFELNVVDYLHKPFSLPRFIQALAKVKERLSHEPSHQIHIPEDARSEDGFIFIKHEGEMVRIDVNDIEFVEAVGDYVHINLTGQKYLSLLSMKKMASLLAPYRFHRVHKSFIVNLRKVTSISGSTIFLRSRGIPIGGSYRNQFMDIVKTYMA